MFLGAVTADRSLLPLRQQARFTLQANHLKGDLQVARKADDNRLDTLCEAIVENPGKRAGWLARLLGEDNKTITRALPQLEKRGDLLAEDDKGGLTWFGRRR